MNWHRLFGLILTDVFTDLPFIVELEKDLSLQQQYLDVAVIRKSDVPFDRRLPDGLHDLKDHNLISFKSYQEPLDGWAVKELIGQYVPYRKQVNPADEPLPPEEQFRLIGACARFPSQLAGVAPLTELQPGVFECDLFIQKVRIIVVRDLPEEPQNALLHLFSAVRERVEYGQKEYRQYSPETSTLVHELLNRYKDEGAIMPYTMEDFKRYIREKTLSNMTTQEILEWVPVEERLEGVPVEKRLEGVPVEKRLEGVPAEKRLEGLSAQDIETHLKKIKENGVSSEKDSGVSPTEDTAE